MPGAIGGWKLAIEAARAVGGKGVPLPVLLHAAIGQARDGYTVTKSQARLTTEKLSELKNVPGFAQTFLIDGKPPEVGTKLKQDALVYTLDHLSRVGLDDFYRGDVGREIAADLERIGSPVTRDDLRHYHANIADPLSVSLNVGTLYNTPPPTQGLASLIILALYERLRVADAESFEFAHGLVECTKRAFRVRDRIVTDPTARAAAARRFPRSEIPRHSRSRRSTAARRRNGRRRPARATPSGWAPPTRPASLCPTSSRSTGSSARAACCPRPAC